MRRRRRVRADPRAGGRGEPSDEDSERGRAWRGRAPRVVFLVFFLACVVGSRSERRVGCEDAGLLSSPERRRPPEATAALLVRAVAPEAWAVDLARDRSLRLLVVRVLVRDFPAERWSRNRSAMEERDPEVTRLRCDRCSRSTSAGRERKSASVASRSEEEAA